jgi:hypothetical protein
MQTKQNILKRFLKSTTLFLSKKIVLILTLVLAISLVFSWDKINSSYLVQKKQKETQKLFQEIGITKSYEDMSITDLHIRKATLQTRWKNGLMYYKIYLIADSTINNNVINDNKSEYPIYSLEDEIKTVNKIIIELLDQDGFKLFSFNIDYDDLTRVINKDGRFLAFSINSNIRIDPNLYKDFDKWIISYTKN